MRQVEAGRVEEHGVEGGEVHPDTHHLSRGHPPGESRITGSPNLLRVTLPWYLRPQFFICRSERKMEVGFPWLANNKR
jgi:hypothetical protein